MHERFSIIGGARAAPSKVRLWEKVKGLKKSLSYTLHLKGALIYIYMGSRVNLSLGKKPKIRAQSKQWPNLLQNPSHVNRFHQKASCPPYKSEKCSGFKTTRLGNGYVYA